MRQRLQPWLQSIGDLFTRQKFFEQESVQCKLRHFSVRVHREEFVAEPQETGRLEPYDRDAAIDEWLQCGKRALRLAFRFVNETRGEKSAPAAKRPRFVFGSGQMHRVAGRLQDRVSGARVVGL